jgi:hypothetical protein
MRAGSKYQGLEERLRVTSDELQRGQRKQTGSVIELFGAEN